MEVNKLTPEYIPLIEPIPHPENRNVRETSLLSSTPEEIERNIQAWRELKERIHIIV